MDSWRIAAELAVRLGTDFDLETVDEVQDEIARVAPAFAGVDAALLRRARDGAVLPLTEHTDELALGAGRPGAGVSWEPIPPRPDADAIDAPASTNGDGAIAAPAPPVELHRWTGTGATAAAAPTDAYSLRLVAGRTLYGSDRVVAASPSIAGLAEEVAVLLVSPRDRDRLGVADGDRVRVSTARGSVDLPLRGDAQTPLGVAFVAVNRMGPGAPDLIDTTTNVTDLRVETLT